MTTSTSQTGIARWGWSRVLRACALMSLCLLCVSPAHADLILSKSAKFRIPFQFDAEELKRLGASEIQLYVTTNQGSTWELAQSVGPEQNKFTFEATEDGEHWFSVRTLTRGGLTYPPGPHLPSLQVLVDTTHPTFELEVEEVEPGRVRLSWSAKDERLNAESLILEYLDPSASQWETVTVSHLATGQTSWTVANAGMLSVRGAVKDTAGNLTKAEAQVTMSVAPDQAGEKPDFSRPVADVETKSDTSMQVHATAIANQPISVENEVLPKIRESFTKKVSTPEAEENLKAIINPLPRTNKIASEPEVVMKPTEPENKQVPEPVLESMPVLESSPEPELPQPKILANSQLSKPVGGHLVNSQSFRVAYELDNVGPSGVSSVELYITEDKGSRWYHYGSDPDRMSPFEVSVPRDGEYGFAFRVRNGVGVIATPPQPGDLPEVRVSVDRAPPLVQLLPIREGVGKNQVVIEWTAQDKQLDENPIALYHAHQQGGPWELIQGWTKNSGTLTWDVPSTFDKKLYVRLEVRDTAGNVTTVQTDRPFMLDQSKPKARVTDVESLRPEAR